MATQKRLQTEALAARKEQLSKNKYQKDIAEYSENSSKARWDGDGNGKGTGVGMTYSIPNASASKTIYTHNIDTTRGGNAIDRESKKKAQLVNLYSENNPYEPDSIDIYNEELRAAGQYFVK